ncbi:hypothetical protein CHS0354_006805, partial [Potamilus streckersoni]
MADNEYTQADIARKTGLSPAAVNQILHEKYPSSPSHFLMRIEDALNMSAPKRKVPNFIETSMVKLITKAAVKARQEACICVVSGAPGTGKTRAVKNLNPLKNLPVYLVEADTVMTADRFLSEISQSIGIEVYGRPGAKFGRIIEKLYGTPALLVIDEADTLRPNVLETARRIKDKAEIGMLLIGNDRLNSLLRPKDGVFDKLRSRIKFYPKYVSSISIEDEILFTETYLPGLPED